mgnify:CR=1 FL=1
MAKLMESCEIVLIVEDFEEELRKLLCWTGNITTLDINVWYNYFEGDVQTMDNPSQPEEFEYEKHSILKAEYSKINIRQEKIINDFLDEHYDSEMLINKVEETLEDQRFYDH